MKACRCFVAAVVIAGCSYPDSPSSSQPPPAAQPVPVQPPQVATPTPMPQPVATPTLQPVATPQPQPAPIAAAPGQSPFAPVIGGGVPLPNTNIAPPVNPAVPTEQVKADVGVGQAGRSLDGAEGVYVTPAKTLFAARQLVVFRVAIPDALRLFEGENGRPPQSHQEFMEQVIRPNNIQLPTLPPGAQYLYDPQTKELMVQRPRR